MKNSKSRTLWYVMLLIVGGVLFLSSEILEEIDSFWGGLGIALSILAILRLLQLTRIKTSEEYAKKWVISNKDERNIYISNEARAKTFLYTVIIEAILIIIFTALNMTDYIRVLSCVLVGQIVIYWLLFLILRKKY